MIKRTLAVAIFSIVLLGAGCTSSAQESISSRVLLDKTGQTILSENFSYPIVTLPPGSQTGLHLHEAPMYAYILQGTLEVTYLVEGVEETKIYQEGEAIMEGLDTPHNGRNTTKSPVKVLVVNLGSPDLENTVKLE
jgi:quercetin dioxygenase-like cupin family protein